MKQSQLWHIAAVMTATAAVLTMLLGSVAAARVALVIGNGEYAAAGNLKNARNDAEAVAGALSRLGFRVIEGKDADQEEMRRLVREFSRQVEETDVALFYYAGHALQLNGKNYLVPVDAKLERESDLDFETMDIEVVLRQMERQSGTSIVLLDSCRNNPLATKLAGAMGQRSAALGKGLARIESGVGSFIGFATQPDNIAYDGKGDHSPFTSALLKHIETPGLDVEMMMRRVREDVILATGGRQVPWSNSSLVGDSVLLGPVPAGADEADRQTGSEVEVAYWDTVRDSGNPSLLEAYLEDYPDGSFATLARAMLDEIGSSTRSVVRTVPAIILGPLPVEAVPDEAADRDDQNVAPAETAALSPEPDSSLAVEAEPPAHMVVPIPRKKPEHKRVTARDPQQQKAPAKKATQQKAPQKKAPAQKAPRRQAPAKAAISAPRQAKECDFCYGCEAGVHMCRRKWTCGSLYRELLAAGLCRR